MSKNLNIDSDHRIYFIFSDDTVFMKNNSAEEISHNLNEFLLKKVSENLDKVICKTEPFKHWLYNSVL